MRRVLDLEMLHVMCGMINRPTVLGYGNHLGSDLSPRAFMKNTMIAADVNKHMV